MATTTTRKPATVPPLALDPDRSAEPLPPHYADLCGTLREVGTLASVASLLNWDQETYMPSGGADARAEQSSLMAGITHERRTSQRVGDLLAACEADRSLTGDESSPTARCLKQVRRDYDRATRLPKELVAELAKVGSQSQEVWKEARARSDFAMFAPWLARMMDLQRKKAECYGTPEGGELYDALLDEYEPSARAAAVEQVFTPLRKDLADLIKAVKGSKKKVSDACLRVKVSKERQHEFGQLVVRAMGFDLNMGRLDTTTHPFCSEVSAGDTRLTTRYGDRNFPESLSSTMHEAGHGLYEQGLPKQLPGYFGTPLAEAVSLGIHESQSRMWENFVGRSREFWAWALPHAKRLFKQGATSPVGRFTPDQFYRAVNTVTPSLIRVESDEGTYNMHVMIRFELERALIAGRLKIKDLPGEWNARYQDYLGIKVPDDRRGCLQDVHWSFGLVGYFPTYTLGNLYAAQLWETINEQMPTLPKQMSKGEFLPLRNWLKHNIHRHGRRFTAGELCERITGRPLSAEPLLRHLRGKAAAVYGV